MSLGIKTILGLSVSFWRTQSCSESKLSGSANKKPAAEDATPERTGSTPDQPTTPEDGGSSDNPSDNKLDTDNGDSTQISEFQIPPEEFDGIDGSTNAWIRGGNHAYFDRSRCPRQVTNAAVDNGGIRINFKSPPASGKLALTVKTQHARWYRVGYAADIVGPNLPTSYTHNSTYIYECEFASSVYNCIMK